MRRARQNASNNGGAMADVAFLLLIFFMVVTTFNKDYKLAMTLPPYSEETRSGTVPPGTLVKIAINGDNELMIQNQARITDASQNLQSELLAIVMQDKKPIILIQLHPEADYQTYIELLAQLNKAKNEMRQTLASNNYGTDYISLNPEQRKQIEKTLKFKISEQEIILS